MLSHLSSVMPLVMVSDIKRSQIDVPLHSPHLSHHRVPRSHHPNNCTRCRNQNTRYRRYCNKGRYSGLTSATLFNLELLTRQYEGRWSVSGNWYHRISSDKTSARSAPPRSDWLCVRLYDLYFYDLITQIPINKPITALNRVNRLRLAIR